MKFNNAVDFTKATFGLENRFQHTKFSLFSSFKETTFSGETFFNYACFEGEVHFDFSEFAIETYGETQFNHARFLGKISSFEDTNFLGNADFYSVKFSGGALFNRTKFFKNALFSTVDFELWLTFISVTIENKFDCMTWQLVRPTMLWDCKIHKLEYMTHTGESITFNQCTTVVGKKDDGNGFWRFRNMECSGLCFINITEMYKLDFLGANIRETIFESCEWQDVYDKKIKLNHYSKVANHDYIMKNGSDTDQKLLQSLYRQLKINLENSKDYKNSGSFHYQEMNVREHKWQKEDSKPGLTILWLYRHVGDYGESYYKLFKSMIFSILATTYIVAIIEGFWDKDWVNISHCLPNYFIIVLLGLIPSAFQQKAVETATVCQLNLLSKIVIVTEGLILLTLTTLFVMAIRRYFKR